MKKISLLLLTFILLIASSLFVTGCGGCSTKSYNVTVTCQPKEGGTVTGAGSYKKGKTYNLLALPNDGYDFEGWYLNEVKISDSLEFIGTMGVSNIDFVAKFTLKAPLIEQKKLTIKYVDDLGGKVADDYTLVKNKGENYSVPINSLIGYTADKSIVSGQLNENTTVTVTYTRKQYTLNLNYVDEHDNILADVESCTLKYGDTYSYNVGEKVDYYLTSTTTVSGKINKDNVNLSSQLNGTTINLYIVYSPKPYPINFLLLDEENHPIEGASMSSVTKNYLESFNFTPIDIDGYEKGDSVEGSVTLTDSFVGTQLSEGNDELTITFKYVSLNKPRNILIKFVDAKGNTIKDNSSISKKIGEPFSMSIDEINDYDLNTAKMSEVYGNNFNLAENTLNGTIPSTLDFEIVLYYKIKTVNLTINYLTDGGVSVAEKYTGIVDYYGNYSIKSPTVKGYSTNDLTVSGTAEKTDVTKNVYYTVNKHKITINYLYEDKSVASPQKVFNDVAYGSSFSVASPEIEGHTPSLKTVAFTFNDDEDKIVTVTYTTNSYFLTINYTSDVNGFTVPSQYKEKIKYNETYKVETPYYYGLKADKNSISGKKLAKDEEFTVTYTNYDIKLYISYFDKTSKALVRQYTLKASFENPSDSIDDLPVEINGYDTIYSKLTFKIEYINNITSFSFIGIKRSNSEDVNLTSSIVNSFKVVYYGELVIYTEKIVSSVTVNYVYDGNKNNVLATKTFSGYCGDSVDISKDFGAGYIKDSSSTSFYTSNTYKYTAEDKSIYVNYTRIEKTVTVEYVDATLGFELSPTVTKTYKYGDKISITSPTIECYKADKETITATMGLEDLSFVVKYTVQWEVDDDDALVISSPQLLATFSKYSSLWQRDISITENLDLTGITISPIGNYSNVFSGDVKGNNKTISNLKLTNDNVVIDSKQVNGINVSYAYVGLFGCFSGNIESLSVTNAEIDVDLGVADKTNVYAGILIGQYSNNMSKGIITGVSVSGSINVNARNNVLGGLVGFNSNTNSEISNCNVNATINSSSDSSNLIGGISGYEVLSNIHNCEVMLTTSLTENDTTNIGGVVGESVNGVIHTNSSNITKACGKENNTIIY